MSVGTDSWAWVWLLQHDHDTWSHWVKHDLHMFHYNDLWRGYNHSDATAETCLNMTWRTWTWSSGLKLYLDLMTCWVLLSLTVLSTVSSGILKDYLRELPSPLITRTLYQVVREAMTLRPPPGPPATADPQLAQTTVGLLSCLPPPERVIHSATTAVILLQRYDGTFYSVLLLYGAKCKLSCCWSSLFFGQICTLSQQRLVKI